MKHRAILALGAVVLLAAGFRVSLTPEQGQFEVWAADQNGNLLYVLDPAGRVRRTVDSTTLGNARRPHMIWAVTGDRFAYITNTVSNSVTVLDRRDGSVEGVINAVGKAPHAAQPNPLRSNRIYVANIGPRAAGPDGAPDRGETITEIVRGGGARAPTWSAARWLDLKSAPALADSTRFPSRRPVCMGFSRDGRHMLVTLFNGGLAVVDLDRWEVVSGWGRDQIAQHGCGFATSPDRNELYVTAGDMQSSWLYVVDVSGTEPRLVRTHNLSQTGQDAHGVAVDAERGELWVAHRVSSNVTIHPLATIKDSSHAYTTLAFVGKTPDLIALSPRGDRAYISLRGPKPAPTIPHATVGETPGVAVIDVIGRRLIEVVKLGNQETGDFHGILVPEAYR